MNCPKCQAPILDDSRFCSKCGEPIHSTDETATRTVMPGAFGELTPGTIVAGKFKILEVAGRGGMGVVYKAEDTKLRRTVALKFLPLERVESKEVRERFLVEARAAAALSHPNICTIYEIYDQDERPFIVMEYVEGSSLRVRMRDHALETNEAVEIALQVADALEEAHGKGIVHRDIKSANIMLTEKGQAKVMDFGLAKVHGESLHTREGTTLGTAAYMSPEQAQGKPVDRRTDVWALGVVLYEMLSGRLPFGGEHHTAVLYAVVHEEPKPLSEAPKELVEIVSRALKKDLKARYGSGAEMGRDLRRYRDRQKVVAPSLLRPKLMIPAAAMLALLLAAGGWWYYRQIKIRWARQVALPEIERLVLSTEAGYTNLPKAYRLAAEAERYIPADPTLSRLFERCSRTITITTEPPGAAVSMKEFTAGEDRWEQVGVSPVEKVRIPRGFFWLRLERNGYENVLAAAVAHVHRVLDAKGSLPPGMVRVSGAKTDFGQLGDFFIDRYEVTNRQYREFVDKGGYRDAKYWTHPFMKEGRKIGWEEAMAGFLDQTGRPGPSTWQAGEYPNGQEDYPVSGVSWYEAAAYAEYAGKSLPTVYHWGLAAGEAGSPGGSWLSVGLTYVSNFKGEGPASVGRYPSMTPYGAYDMPGNVREWCWNETPHGRTIRGGAWNDAAYMMSDVTQAPAWDRSPKNGFRCVIYPGRRSIAEEAFGVFEVPVRDFRGQTPAPDSIFKVYREQFSYDKRELHAQAEWQDTTSADWIQEKIAVDAAYGGERLPIYLFLPKKSSPPYQSIIYFPGSTSTETPSSKNLEHYPEFEQRLSVIVKTGRAVVFPVYKGTFERRDAELTAINSGAPTHQFSEYAVQLVKDFRRTVDYLETRSELDGKRLAFLGYSWGARMSPLVLATEDRVRAAVLVVGGMRANSRPETSFIHYVPRVKMPVLMLNGKYDMFFPFDTMVKPQFDLLGTPAEHKRLVVYETDHFVPRTEYIKETLAWLDKYLGPVK